MCLFLSTFQFYVEIKMHVVSLRQSAKLSGHERDPHLFIRRKFIGLMISVHAMLRTICDLSPTFLDPPEIFSKKTE